MASQRYHILKEYANGVMDEKGRFFPFRSMTSGAAGYDLTAKTGIRYFIKSVILTYSKAGASAADCSQLSCTIRGVQSYIGAVSIPETFAASNESNTMNVDVGILCDLKTGLTLSGTAFPIVIYAEIEEAEGEYSG